MGKGKKNTFTTEQLLDINLKNIGGESRLEVSKRIQEAFNEVLIENQGKNIAIVSHGATLKFLLMDWCTLNENYQLEFKEKEINLNSPGIIRLVFEGKTLKDLTQIV